ncbi:MAG: HD domain-containing protein [Patescibacteria group bacterium]
MNKKDLDFLFEVGSLRNMQRGWGQHLGMDCASVLEHTIRVVWLALMIARMEGVKSEEKIIKMALVHDIVETRTSDLGYVQKVYVKADEEKAAQDLFGGTLLNDLHETILKEYEARETIEAKIVKDADNLDVDLELKELEERGSKLPAKMEKFRQLVYDEKLYTDSAKKIWETLQDAEVADWHLQANKWIKLSNVGK